MEPLSNRSDRDSNLPEYYQQTSYTDNNPSYNQNTPSYNQNNPSYDQNHPSNIDNIPPKPEHTTEPSKPSPPAASSNEKDRHRLPFGWTPIVFGVVIALISAIIVGAAVGGGVGGALSGSDSDCKAGAATAAAVTSTVYQSISATSAATSSATSTTSTSSASLTEYSPLSYTEISGLALDCPTLDSQNYKSVWEGQLFNLHCDFLYNEDNIASMFVYSWQECVDACASANHYAVADGRSNTTCSHMLFQAGFDDAVEQYHRNCWIKGTGATVGTPDPARRLLAADLIV